jgi:hypothetical protein
MATVLSPSKKSKQKYAFYKIFEPSAGACNGACSYTWDSKTKQYVLNPGDTCTGSHCQPCAQYKSSIVRELVVLEHCFPNPDAISYQCGGSTEDSFNALLGLYVDLLKRYTLLVKFAFGLGLVLAALLFAVFYLLVR